MKAFFYLIALALCVVWVLSFTLNSIPATIVAAISFLTAVVACGFAALLDKIDQASQRICDAIERSGTKIS